MLISVATQIHRHFASEIPIFKEAIAKDASMAAAVYSRDNDNKMQVHVSQSLQQWEFSKAHVDFHSSSFRSCTHFNFTAKESVVHSKAPGPLTSHGIEGVSVRPAQLAHLRLHANVAEGVRQQGLD